jgi:ketosteroid isomerase-like protein
MKHLAIACISLYLAGSLTAQPDSLQRQINEQVWKPFLESYNTYDAEKFMSVHHPEALRVVQEGGRLLTFAEYAKNTAASMKRGLDGNRDRKLELRFTQRIATPENAFEVGFYKLTVNRPDGSSDAYYGKFHVVLKKTEGRWKIWLDADTPEGADEQVFQAASPLE